MVASSPVRKNGWNVLSCEDPGPFYRAAWSSSQDPQSEEPGRGDPVRWAWFTLQLLTFAALHLSLQSWEYVAESGK